MSGRVEEAWRRAPGDRRGAPHLASPSPSPEARSGTPTKGDGSARAVAGSGQAATRETARTIGVAAGLFLLVHLVAGTARVEGPSMEPTLLPGQMLLVSRLPYQRLPFGDQGYLLGGPRRGDVVILRPPCRTDHVDFVKRLVGLPGDEVLVAGGELYVNGQRVDERYAPIRPDYTYPPDGRPVRVPSGSYFVLGDNRPNSIDSHRGWFVPEANLKGLVLARFWPIEQATPIPRTGT